MQVGYGILHSEIRPDKFNTSHIELRSIDPAVSEASISAFSRIEVINLY